MAHWCCPLVSTGLSRHAGLSSCARLGPCCRPQGVGGPQLSPPLPAYLPVSGGLDCFVLGWPRGPGGLSVVWVGADWVERGSFLGALFLRPEPGFPLRELPLHKAGAESLASGAGALGTCVPTELKGSGLRACLSLLSLQSLGKGSLERGKDGQESRTVGASVR